MPLESLPAHDAPPAADPTCHVCNYDLRAHPHDGRCPECGASVAESHRISAIPRRPAWRDADPRWRRRILAGVWLLALLPLTDVLKTFGWASAIPVPRVLDARASVNTLDETLFCHPGVYLPTIFCTGVVLLFAREGGRRPARLDWTRRWGVLSTYVVLLLSAAEFLFLVALVMTGIAALAISIALKYQPAATPILVRVSTTYLYYGPHPTDRAAAAHAAFSALAVLLACVPLLDALRSSGPKRLAPVLVAPLALAALAHFARVAPYGLGFVRGTPWGPWDSVFRSGFFWPTPLVGHVANAFGYHAFAATPGVVLVEAVKWCTVLAIATWLTLAQLATRRRRPDKPNPAPPRLT